MGKSTRGIIPIDEDEPEFSLLNFEEWKYKKSLSTRRERIEIDL